jgi:hypothetical protein
MSQQLKRLLRGFPSGEGRHTLAARGDGVADLVGQGVGGVPSQGFRIREDPDLGLA